MGCKCAPALRRLQAEVNALFPDRDKSSDGCCASAKHSTQNPSSDHEPGAKGAPDGYAHAIDIDEDLSPSLGSLDFLVPILLADSRTKYVIYEGRIHYPPATVKPYTGVNAHKHHLHLSIKSTATFETRSWLTSLSDPSPAPPPSEEEDVPPAPAIVRANGHWLVFSRGASDGRLYCQVDGGGQTAAQEPGKPAFVISSGPSASVADDGTTVKVVARGMDGAVATITRAANGEWVNQGSLGGET